MTEAEREELIAKVARYIACASSTEDDPEADWCYENWPAYETQARAALAAAEPVIREQCAKICEGDFDAEMKGYGDYFATAIREGGKDD